MNFLRPLVFVLVGYFTLQPSPGDDAPVVFDKHFSADQVITTKDGTTVTNKIYTDDAKVRTEMEVHGLKIVAIIRPDQQKIYSIMAAQKMVMEMPYDPAKYKQEMAAATGVDGKFETVGADTIDGTACTKYKVTSKDGNIYYLWADAKKMPIKMMAADGTFTMLWKNYAAGPQNPSLFEVPAGYQVVSMPNMPDIPQLQGGGG